ncbi:MAG TPA: phosphatase PAP2 family protein [Solirubrobacteraceae bacterium]|nr:phosphatase PAP2 family protein [Solirubrobacteraceae bacterium]
MQRAPALIAARLLPRGWTDLFRQMGLFAGAFFIYDIVRGIVGTGSYAPFGHATQIIGFERTLHIFVEPSVQAWAQGQHWLIWAADFAYLNGHFLVTLGALIFIYSRRNESYYFVRNALMISMALALLGYWLYPTAPPRLLPEWGFTDSVSQFLYHGTGWIDNGTAKLFTNFYAAVPSMHVCFAVVIGVSMARLVRHRTVRVLWYLYPLLVTFVVVATANHYLVDVFLGAITAAVSALMAHRLLARARPEVWAFAPAPA